MNILESLTYRLKVYMVIFNKVIIHQSASRISKKNVFNIEISIFFFFLIIINIIY